MHKQLASLLIILFFSTWGYAADDPHSSDADPSHQANEEAYDSDSEIAQGPDSPSSGARWYKSRAGRREYLKGGTDYPGADREAEHHQVSPSSDARWNKNRSGR